MITLDYFLYDNRTSTMRTGPDWSIKRATGLLERRADMLALFWKYGKLTHGETRQLRDFDVAVGGIPEPAGPGYLLCITLQTTDLTASRRPAFALVGLWCPDRDVLATVVKEGDPIESAKIVLQDRPPQFALDVLPAPSRRARTLRAADQATILRFTMGHSAAIALDLIQSTPSNRPLPAILGITATGNLAHAATKGPFDIVFSLPMDDRAKQALQAVVGSESVLEREWAPDLPPVSADREMPAAIAPDGLDSPRGEERTPRRELIEVVVPQSQALSAWSFHAGSAVLGFLVGVVLTVATFLVWPGLPPATATTTWTEVAEPRTAPPPAESPAIENVTLDSAIEAMRTLDPALLMQSPGYRTVQSVAVVEDHEDDRAAVRRAYEALLEQRITVIDAKWREQLTHYLAGAGGGAGRGEWEGAIKQLRASATVTDQCDVLTTAFGEELSSTDSIAGEWCSVFSALERQVQAAVVNYDTAQRSKAQKQN